MDVFAGREIHHRIGSPFRGPTHFFDFFLDARRHGTVANVGIDLYQEVTPNDHRFAFGVIDIHRNDRTAGGNFTANELGSDFIRDPLRETRENRRGIRTAG